MANSDYEARQDVIHDLTRQIEELLKDNEILKRQLEEADMDAAKFKVQVMQLENGQIELIAKLEESKNEVSRLGMVLKHQESNLEAVRKSSGHIKGLNKGLK